MTASAIGNGENLDEGTAGYPEYGEFDYAARILGVSTETAATIGLETCGALERGLDRLEQLRGIMRIEPATFATEHMNHPRLRNEPYVSVAERLSAAMHTFDSEQNEMAKATRTGVVALTRPKVNRSPARDTIGSLVPRILEADVATDMGTLAMDDLAAVARAIAANALVIGQLPRTIHNPENEERFLQLTAISRQLAALQMVDPAVTQKLIGLLETERAASTAEIVQKLNPDLARALVPDVALAVWTGTVANWQIAIQVAKRLEELLEGENKDLTLFQIELDPEEAPVNDVYRSVELIHADVVKIQQQEGINSDLHRRAAILLASLREECADTAQRFLGSLTADVHTGLKTAESIIYGQYQEAVDTNAFPYNLLPRDPKGQIQDERYVQFIQRVQQGVFPRIHAVKKDLEALIEKAVQPWPDKVRHRAIEQAGELPVAQDDTSLLSRDEATALIRQMADKLKEDSVTPLERVITGKVSKKVRLAKREGNQEAVREMTTRQALRDTCDFSAPEIGLIMAVINGEWQNVVDAKNRLSDQFQHLNMLAENADSPSLLVGHSLRPTASHDFGPTIQSIKERLNATNHRVNNALDQQQLKILHQVVSPKPPALAGA